MSDIRCAVKGLQVRYPDSATPVLKDIELTVSSGECVMIGGLSGSGKSTLLRAIADVLPGSAQKEGEIEFPNQAPSGRRRMGWIQQNPETQLFCLTPLEEVRFGFEVAGETQHSDEELVDYLRAFDLQDRAQSLNRSLSSGEKQLTVVAAVLAGKPELILLDEPTSFMSPQAAQKILQILMNAKHQGAAILMVEHNRFVAELVDRIVFLEDGAIASESSTRPFPELQVLQRFGLEPRETLKLAVPDNRASASLIIEELSFSFGTRKILNNISVNLDAARLHIFHGLNGSGKSTLLYLIAGYLSPQHGRFFMNQKLLQGKHRRKLTYCIFSLPERQFLTTTVKEELEFGGMGKTNSTRLERVVSSLNLSSLWNRSIRELSMGQKQRLVLAASMLQDRAIFLMDEPTLGMDWKHIQGMMQLIGDCLAEEKTIIMATHHKPLADLYGYMKHELREGVLVTTR